MKTTRKRMLPALMASIFAAGCAHTPPTIAPVGRVVPGTNNAVWDMQVFWPIKAEYVIVGLNNDYSQTIIGRSKRDYAWVMARTPTISEQDYQAALVKLKALGYSLDKLRKVPQQWPEATP